MPKTRDALKILDDLTGDDTALRQLIEVETLNAKVAHMIYQARTKAGLTQQQLATLIGTKQPVIARLEDADYEGHSLGMLQRIASALNRRLDIRMTSPSSPARKSAARSHARPSVAQARSV